MTAETELNKGLSDIVGALTDPVIVMPGGWGDTLPKWLKDIIPLERLAMNVKALRGEPITGTDAEACAYLYTASLNGPMSERWTRIYLHIAGREAQRHQHVTLPADILVESLSPYDQGELDRLKAWIYHQRVRQRLERDRGERRAAKEQKEIEQMSLFKFEEWG